MSGLAGALSLITLDGVLVNLGYGLMLLALLARDILWLRLILILAQSCLCSYALHSGATNVAAWNGLFVAINIVQVIRILLERRAVQLPDGLDRIYALNFSVMTVPEFLGLWRRADAVSDFTGELLAQGALNDRLIVMTEGEVRVVVHGHEVARLGPGQLVAEMSFLTDEPTSAAVVADAPVSYRYWTRSALERTRIRKPALWSKLQAAIGRDLVRKIRHADSQAAPSAEAELREHPTT
ncbi:cyclic nucleotide-binding domain-containing protein [uncultured Abyssibacter sp.]|uniref:cyclic nucleotide-binding domain-containing protein n=1 Tax=uncultured Abyssibacter sp. TaxID=2320202 RepID=UPI0032B240B8